MKFNFSRRAFSTSILISVLALGICLWVVSSALDWPIDELISGGLSAFILICGLIASAAIGTALVTFIQYTLKSATEKKSSGDDSLTKKLY